MKKFFLVLAILAMGLAIVPVTIVQAQEATPESVPVWAMPLSDADAACAVASFTQYGIEPVNSVVVPSDNSPSPTLAMVGVLSQGDSAIEVNPEGRQITFRGGEAGQIQSANGQVLISMLMDNVRAHAAWYSDPVNGVVAVGGEALSEVGLTALSGAAKVDIQVFYNHNLVTEVKGNMSPLNNVGTVFSRLDAFDLSKFVPGSWNAGNLKGLTVPVDATGCVDFVELAKVPGNMLFTDGIGTAQAHLSEQSLLVLPQ